VARPIKIIFIGDSLTEYFDWQGRFPGCQVVNLGIAGESVEELLMRMQEIRSAVKDPDIIFLMTGINNIAMEEDQIVGTYRKIVASLVSSYRAALVVIQSILPVFLPWVDNRVIERTNRSLEEISLEYKAEYLDIYSVFADKEKRPIEGYLLDDGVHLSNKGYEVWAKVVEGFLKSSMNV
jgi:lysophospholipase L1-like esterase